MEHAVAVNSGTIAIAVALMAFDIGPGDEVIVPDLTFIATANAVKLAGAVPVLVDIEPSRFAINCKALETAITPYTKAIISVDVNGRGADYRFLEPFCLEQGLRLICDSAEALGSKYDDRPLGSFGDAAALSFSPNKTITTGQGGRVLTCSANLSQRIRQRKDQGRLERGTGGNDLHPTQGYNFKFTDLQAAVGLAQLEALQERCLQAGRRDSWYKKHLASVSFLSFPDYKSQKDEVRQWTDVMVKNRAYLEGVLKNNEIGHRAFWFPLHTQIPYSNQKRSFGYANSVSEKGLWLPSHFTLTEADVVKISSIIKRAFDNM